MPGGAASEFAQPELAHLSIRLRRLCRWLLPAAVCLPGRRALAPQSTRDVHDGQAHFVHGGAGNDCAERSRQQAASPSGKAGLRCLRWPPVRAHSRAPIRIRGFAAFRGAIEAGKTPPARCRQDGPVRAWRSSKPFLCWSPDKALFEETCFYKFQNLFGSCGAQWGAMNDG